MNARQAERVRSYLRGRLQRTINPLAPADSGQYICHAKYEAGLSFARDNPELLAFEGTLAEIAAHFNVTIPDSVMEESASAHPKP